MADGCTFVQHYFQTDTFDVSVRKDACGIFGGNGVISMLFVLAAADQLSVDLGVINQTVDL
jgi:adenine-specific DNA methylase